MSIEQTLISLFARGMAYVRRNMVVMAVAMAAVVAMALPSSVARVDPCANSEEPVYPYWSVSTNPAAYFDESFYVSPAANNSREFFMPEYDETNDTYYVRLTKEETQRARYILTYNRSDTDERVAVKQSDDVVFLNAETNRALSWREEGEDELFLVESSDDDRFVRFRFELANKDMTILCPDDVDNAKCEAYYFVQFTAPNYGLSTYAENGTTYIKRGSDKYLALQLLRAPYNNLLDTAESHATRVHLESQVLQAAPA